MYEFRLLMTGSAIVREKGVFVLSDSYSLDEFISFNRIYN